MCGRYTLSTPGDELGALFGLSESLELEPRFNIAPTQRVPIVRLGKARRLEARLCRWGLVPYWARDPSIGNRLINARAETLAEKRAYRESFERRRCLVPADGFYEWRPVGRQKQPFYFSRPTGEPFAMAGLWDRWRQGEEPIESFTVVTTDANREVAEVHDRMPVLLEPREWPLWLGLEEASGPDLATLLDGAPDGWLIGRPVSTYVNSPANDSSRCVETVEVASGAEVQPGLF